MLARARRYRPKRFSDLLVQDHVAAVLRGAVALARVGHGYLLTGPRGVGKTTAARILAMALNCPRRDPTGEPCGECDNCRRIWTGAANLDVVEIDAASNRGVDDARDLRERAMYAASQEGGFKVYIVDEAHMLTREAWNALLKILEEPPPRVVFVFATTEPHKIAATAAPVLSRLQRFDFRRIGPAAIRERLQQVLAAEGISADQDALTLIARHADGGMRDGLSILDQCLSLGEGAVTVERVREVLGLADDELYLEALRIVVQRESAGVFPLVERLVDAGTDLIEFIGGVGETLRALMQMQLGGMPEGLTERLRRGLEESRDKLRAGDVLRMLRLLAENEPVLRRSANPRLMVETLLLRWAMLDRTIDLREVLALATAEGTAELSEPGAELRGSAPVTSPQPITPEATPPPPTAPARLADAGPTSTTLPEPAGDLPVKLEAIAEAWPGIVALVRARKQFLGEALARTRPTALEPPWLTVTFTEPSPLFAGALQREAVLVEEVLRGATGQALQLRVADGIAGPADPPAPKLSEASLKADRLRQYRAKDPTLDAVADELDLEIVD